MPILGQIRSAQITNVIIIVVRYFGGTKLGATGLIRAYKTSAEDAISNGKIVTKYLTSTFFLETSYQRYPHLLDALKRSGLTFKNPVFNDSSVGLSVEVRRSKIESSFANVLALLLHRSSDEIKDIYAHPDVLIIDE